MGCEFSKLYNLEIHLENDLGIFEPLDVVAGHVLIQVENDTTIHHCLLTLRGLAHVSFQKEAGTGPALIGSKAKAQPTKHEQLNVSGVSEKFQILLMRTEDLLNQYQAQHSEQPSTDSSHSDPLIESQPQISNGPTSATSIRPAVSEFIITKGLHVFNFEFQLPAELPASFVLPEHVPESVGMRAFVVYNVKVEVVNIVHQVSHSRERDILLFRSMDLTQYPKLKDKVTLRKEFQITDRCASKSVLLCELTVNKCAFVPGEVMKVEVAVKNGSSKPIESVQLSLFQEGNYSTFIKKHEEVREMPIGFIFPRFRYNSKNNLIKPCTNNLNQDFIWNLYYILLNY